MFSGREGRLCGGRVFLLHKRSWVSGNLTWRAAEHSLTELRRGRSEKCLWPRSPCSRAPLRTDRVARDWRHAPTPLCWPRVTRGSHFDEVSGSAGRKGGTKTTFTDLRAMHWQHGQVVQGAPRIQNSQSTPSGASETGLQKLSHWCARYAWLPTNKLRGHVPEPRTAGHPRCLHTAKGAGLRGPVHSRWKYRIQLELEHCGVPGYQVCVTQTPTYQGGNNRKEQPSSRRRCHSHPGCCWREC